MEMELGGEGTASLPALTHALHPQGRAGADGARGMPGEPGVKVVCLPSCDTCICLACPARAHQFLMGYSPPLIQDRVGRDGTGLDPPFDFPSSS